MSELDNLTTKQPVPQTMPNEPIPPKETPAVLPAEPASVPVPETLPLKPVSEVTPVLETPTTGAAPTTPALFSRDEATPPQGGGENSIAPATPATPSSPEAPAPATLLPAAPVSEIQPSASTPAMPSETQTPSSTELSPAAETKLTQPAPTSQTSKPAVENQNIISLLLNKARLKIKERKEARLNKILSALAEKGRLSSKEICRLVKKSRVTVFRSMNQLEQLGKVRQVGKKGKSVYYELVR